MLKCFAKRREKRGSSSERELLLLKYRISIARMQWSKEGNGRNSHVVSRNAMLVCIYASALQCRSMPRALRICK
jgi:hypothetical protein